MSRDDRAAFNRRWCAEHDESTLHLFVSVDQVFGTRAQIYQVLHKGLPHEEYIRYARYTSDDLDGSTEALWDVFSRLMVLHANRVARELEMRD